MSIRAWQDLLSLKTYPLGPEDPNPPFQRQNQSWAIYPYPMQDDLLDAPPEMKDWTALHIENEYLHCIVLPELGGHLYSLRDKVCDREVFYRNNVVKYGLVATRGAWVSGGIEFNFPTGHTYTTVSPVSWEIGEDEAEGDAWITVGNICRLSRMEWTVKLSLGVNERRLHEEIWLRNTMPYKQRYWFWNNSAVPATEDLHLIYPARKARVGGGIVDYPVTADGLDVSWYKNHDHADDIFTLDVTEDFFGCHYADSDFGMVNFADHRDVYGRKFFTWGTADDGMIWVDLLTDNDGQYVEIQSGRFETQSIWEFLEPYDLVKWDEYWMPEHGMNGWVWASEDAVLNFEIKAGKIHIAVLSAIPCHEAEMVLEAGGRTPWRATVALMPDKPFSAVINMPFGCDEHTEFTLGVWDLDMDEELIRYVHPPAYTRKPKVAETGENIVPPAKAEDDCAAEELCTRAAAAVKRLEHREARRLYEKALGMDDGLSTAHLGLGMLDLRAGLYEPAREHFENALTRDPDNPEAWYAAAVGRWKCGDREGADAAVLESLRRSTPEKAVVQALTTAHMELQDVQAQDLRDDADAMWQMGVFGVTKCTPEHTSKTPKEAAARFRHWARGDAQLWLEEAFFVGPELRIDVLERAVADCPAAAEYPMIHYCLGHWYQQVKFKERAAKAYERAKACPPDYCFPSRLEELPVLEAAVEREPADWKARYCLGNLLASLDRTAEAMAQWRACLTPVGQAADSPVGQAAGLSTADRRAACPTDASGADAFAVLHRNLGLGALRWEDNPQGAAEHYRRAIECNPQDYRYYMDLADIYAKHPEVASPPTPLPLGEGSTTGQEPAVAVSPSPAGRGGQGGEASLQLALFRSAPPEIQEKWQIAARIAELLAGLGRHDEALEILRSHRFFPWEGARQMRTIYASCLVAKGEQASAAGDHAAALADFEAAMEYPRNLGVGKVARPQDARILYLAAQEAGKLNEEAKKTEYLTAAAEEPHAGPCEADWWKLLSLRELGRTDEAGALEKTLREWAERLMKDERTREQGEGMRGRLAELNRG